MSVFSSNPMFAMVIAGVVSMDNFFALSAFFGFYRIKQIYNAQGFLSFKDVLKIYGKRLMRLLPMYYLTLLFGIFIAPRILSNTGGVTYMYEQSLFW
jgi:peptidoglycan/LPS O-acetylase OafA/YrhL